MKNFFLSVIFIVIAAAVLQALAPWWVIAVVAFAVGYLVEQKSYAAFLSGFLGIFLLWTTYAFMLSHANNDILAKKIALILPFKGHVSLLLLTTGFIGGLVGAFASLAGRFYAALSE